MEAVSRLLARNLALPARRVFVLGILVKLWYKQAMHELQAMDLARHAMLVSLQMSLPILLLSLTIGVIVSLFQAVTQIQEQTLTFVPKIIALVLALTVLGPWMLHTIVGFTAGLFASLPTAIH